MMDKQAEVLLNQALDMHRHGNIVEAANIYNQVLNRYPDSHGVLYLLGDIAIRNGCNGLAINLLRTSTVIEPMIEAWTALGCAYRHEHMNVEAQAAWVEGLKIRKTSELFNNLASLHSDHGQPDLALRYVEDALKLEPDNINAKWNRSLALLTKGAWSKAWDDHDARFDPAVQSVSTRREYGCPQWEGQCVNRLVVHGEQGVGDEIMFLSMLQECVERAINVVVEVEPRLMDLVERSFPTVTVYGNHESVLAHEAPFDACIAMASLGKILRTSGNAFPRKPYLKADPERVAYWREEYAKWGAGPYIGVAWQGGTKETRIQQRTIGPKALDFTKRGTAISLQYGEYAQQQALQHGYLFYPESCGHLMDELAAMTAACDLVVTCAQTLVHLAGALGVQTEVLVPLHSSWRYGMGSGRHAMLWYGDNVNLNRQTTADDWTGPLAAVKNVVDQLCEGTEHAANQ